MIRKIRLPPKLAFVSKMRRSEHRRTAVYVFVHEDSRSTATSKFATKVEFLRKSMLITLMLVAMLKPCPASANIQTELETFKPVSNASFYWFAFKVYDAELLTPGGVKWSASAPYALRLQYSRDFSEESLIDRSISELTDGKVATPSQAEGWRDEMATVLTSVKKGDVITAINYPGEKSVFYHNNKLTGTVADAEFTKAYFQIWLGDNSSDREFTMQLRGE
jgi:hypothetical protein